MPTANKLRQLSSYSWAFKMAKPLLRTVGFSVARRLLVPRGRHKLLKLLGLGAVGIGAWQLIDHAADD